MPSYVARPHVLTDEFVPGYLGDSFGLFPFVHGDPLANQFDGPFLVRLIRKEVTHISGFPFGIESRDPDIPSCWHSGTMRRSCCWSIPCHNQANPLPTNDTPASDIPQRFQCPAMLGDGGVGNQKPGIDQLEFHRRRAAADALFTGKVQRKVSNCIAVLAAAGTFALASRLPTVYTFREHVEDGGLISYGVDLRQNYRRGAYFVDRILKGEKPGDLPMEFPTKVELVVNVTTAKAIGLTVPPSLLARTDEVIG
jgi:ABC transporter substrate binding protein